MKKSKKLLKIICAVIAVVIIIGIIYLTNYFISVKNYQEKVNSIAISDINISKIKDGTYTGEYDVDFIYAKVDVTVKNGIITDINLLEHKNERGSSAEKIIEKIIEIQEVDVDAVASATNSSIVIKKAIENALLKGI
jgi:Uncharacterized protein conserved in bacteria